jgi:enoyl reductase-like protein
MKVVELDDVKNDESRREKERIIARMHKAEKNFFGRSPLSKVLENTMSQTSKIRMM